jgi:hypothetical protein
MKPNPRYKHKTPIRLSIPILLVILSIGFPSCGFMHRVFGPKYGCPSDGRNVGAERILSGEKVPKAPKWKGS